MDVAVHPLISGRHAKNLSPLDPRFLCTGKWRRTSSSRSSPSPRPRPRPSHNYFLKNCNGSWRRTSSPIPDYLMNFNGAISQRCHPSMPREAVVAKPSYCAKLNGRLPKIILIKRGEDLSESLKQEISTTGEVVSDESKLFSGSFLSSDSPSPSSLPTPSFVGDKKRVTFNMDDEADLDLELLEFGFLAT